MKVRWIMWIGEPSRVLHAQPDLHTYTVTACGLRAMLVDGSTTRLPRGTYTHCAACRRTVGD